MGNIRTPKPHYFKHGVVEFFVKNKQIHYKTVMWNPDGTNHFVLEVGIFENNIDDIVKRGKQSFSSVGVIEN